MILAFDPKEGFGGDGVGDVLRSDDDGKTWIEVPEVKGKAFGMTEHPFNKERAIIYSEKKEHWATKDKGKTWHKFETELVPSVYQLPLNFNSDNPDYVLFSGTECSQIGRCRDNVSCAALCGGASADGRADLLHQ